MTNDEIIFLNKNKNCVPNTESVFRDVYTSQKVSAMDLCMEAVSSDGSQLIEEYCGI